MKGHMTDILTTQQNVELNTTKKKGYPRYNRFTGQCELLTKKEADTYDSIIKNEYDATMEDKELGYGGSKLWDKVRANLDWFRKHNAKAYMVLLD